MYFTHVETDDFYFQEMQCYRNSTCKDLFTEILKLLRTLQVTLNDFVFSETSMSATRETAW